MTDLSNGADWLKIYDQFHVAQSIPNQSGKHYPILPIVIPTVLDSYTVAISCKPTVTKPTWQLAAKVYSLINVNNSDIETAKFNYAYRISINQVNIIKINRLSTYYRLLIEPVKWFIDAHVEIWVYTGIESPQGFDELVQILNVKYIEN